MTESNKTVLLKPATNIVHRWPANLVEADIEDFKEAKSYATCNASLKNFGKARVSHDSVIYKNGLLVTDTLASANHKSYYRFRHLVKNIITGKKISLPGNKKYLLVTDLWSVGHFHWFCDVLPKLLCIEATTHEFTLLLPDVPYIRHIAIDSLKLLHLRFEDIVLMKETEFYKARHLSYISRVSKTGEMHPELMKKMQQKFAGDNKSADKKIYISRGKAGFRKVVNEDALIDMLKHNGFEILYGEDLSLSDQVTIFSSCHTLLGIHGAGLTNCIFMPPGSNVIELRKKENSPSNVAYWHLADSLDHKYYYYNGVPDSEKPLVGKGCNLTISLSDFEKQVLKKLD